MQQEDKAVGQYKDLFKGVGRTVVIFIKVDGRTRP